MMRDTLAKSELTAGCAIVRGYGCAKLAGLGARGDPRYCFGGRSTPWGNIRAEDGCLGINMRKGARAR